MCSNTDDAIDTLFDTLLQRFQQAIETLNDNGSGFTHESVALLYYQFMKIDIKRAESYNESSDWLKTKEQQQTRKIKNIINASSMQ